MNVNAQCWWAMPTAPFSLALARLMTRDTFTQALAKGTRPHSTASFT